MSVPPEWLPEALAVAKTWTFGELAKDQSTTWLGKDRTGKPRYYTPRQLLHIWESQSPHKIAEMAEDDQPFAIQRQQIATAILKLYPSNSKTV
jgi:hypothetical protein